MFYIKVKSMKMKNYQIQKYNKAPRGANYSFKDQSTNEVVYINLNGFGSSNFSNSNSNNTILDGSIPSAIASGYGLKGICKLVRNF